MVKFKSFFVSPFWGKIFNRYSLTKIFIIFVVGFMSRVFIVATLDVNVFLEFTSYISLAYYSFMAFFAMLVHEFVAYFDFSIFPRFNFFLVNFNALKLSSIRNSIHSYFNRNKINLTDLDNNISNVDNSDLPSSKFYNLSSSENLNYDKFKNNSKRILLWVFWEKYTNNFNSYKVFKENWDPNIKARTIIKKDIKDGIWKVKVFKNTAKRIWDSVFS